MKTIILLAAIVAISTPALAQKGAARRGVPAGKSETLRVSAISLTDEDGTVLTLKDAKGVKLDPVKVPLAICRKDHLGRLLPGMDVNVPVVTRIAAGKSVRTVRAESLRPFCS